MIPLPVPDLAELPAFMGYTISPRGGFIMRCCAWCPTKEAVDALGRLRGMEVSHGCCPSCAAVQIARITGAAI